MPEFEKIYGGWWPKNVQVQDLPPPPPPPPGARPLLHARRAAVWGGGGTGGAVVDICRGMNGQQIC